MGAALLAFLPRLQAQEENPNTIQVPQLVSDRPDFSESTFTVPPGAFQIEAGLTGERLDGTSDVNLGSVDALWRFGLMRDVELRLASGYTWASVSDGEGEIIPDFEGPKALLLGFKWRMLERKTWAVSFLNQYELQTRTTTSGGDVWLGNWLILGSWSPEGSFSLAANAGFTNVSANFYDIATSLSAGWQFTPRVSAFLEGFAETPNSSGFFEPRFDGGVLFLVHPRLQLDVAAGGIIERISDNPFLTLGVTFLGPLSQNRPAMRGARPASTPGAHPSREP